VLTRRKMMRSGKYGLPVIMFYERIQLRIIGLHLDLLDSPWLIVPPLQRLLPKSKPCLAIQAQKFTISGL
jgi:hypothetical protein